MHVASLDLAPRIHPNKEAQIAPLLAKKVKISDEYSDFADVFSEEKTFVLLECTKINK